MNMVIQIPVHISALPAFQVYTQKGLDPMVILYLIFLRNCYAVSDHRLLDIGGTSEITHACLGTGKWAPWQCPSFCLSCERVAQSGLERGIRRSQYMPLVPLQMAVGASCKGMLICWWGHQSPEGQGLLKSHSCRADEQAASLPSAFCVQGSRGPSPSEL